MKSQKDYAKDIGINLKGRAGQFFCSHKNKEWFDDHSLRTNKGVMRYQYCTGCGKECGSRFDEFEGRGFK